HPHRSGRAYSFGRAAINPLGSVGLGCDARLSFQSGRRRIRVTVQDAVVLAGSRRELKKHTSIGQNIEQGNFQRRIGAAALGSVKWTGTHSEVTDVIRDADRRTVE